MRVTPRRILMIYLSSEVIYSRNSMSITKTGGSKPKKSKSKVNRKTVVKKLDKIVGDIVKLRDGSRCVTCGGTKNICPGHLFSRVAYSTRWNLDNVACQCQSCNYRHELNAYPYFDWFLKRYGKARLDELHMIYSTPRPFKTWELEELYDELLVIKSKYA